MHRYYVTFFENGRPVCGTWIEASSEDDALFSAECKLMCFFPNVPYNSVEVTSCE